MESGIPIGRLLATRDRSRGEKDPFERPQSWQQGQTRAWARSERPQSRQEWQIRACRRQGMEVMPTETLQKKVLKLPQSRLTAPTTLLQFKDLCIKAPPRM